MKNDGYYHCDRLLTLKDKNGNTPDIYIVDGNRTAGKSYSIKCRQVSDFLNFLITRASYSLKKKRDCNKSHQSLFLFIN